MTTICVPITIDATIEVDRNGSTGWAPHVKGYQKVSPGSCRIVPLWERARAHEGRA